MNLIQATGLSYNDLIFTPQAVPAVEQSRARFWQQLQNNLPAVIVVGVGLYPHPLDGYGKLANWPLFQDFFNIPLSSPRRTVLPRLREPPHGVSD